MYKTLRQGFNRSACVFFSFVILVDEGQRSFFSLDFYDCLTFFYVIFNDYLIVYMSIVEDYQPIF